MSARPGTLPVNNQQECLKTWAQATAPAAPRESQGVWERAGGLYLLTQHCGHEAQEREGPALEMAILVWVSALNLIILVRRTCSVGCAAWQISLLVPCLCFLFGDDVFRVEHRSGGELGRSPSPRVLLQGRASYAWAQATRTRWSCFRVSALCCLWHWTLGEIVQLKSC